MAFNGLGMNMGNLSRLSRRRRARSARRISPARRARPAWPPKAPALGAPATWARAGRSRPACGSKPGETFTLARHRRPRRDPADLDDPHRHTGASASCASTGTARRSPRSSARSATSSPAAGASIAQITSLAVCVNPGSAFNCYWEMPFRKRCRITLENIADETMTLYYQINYTLTDVPEDAAYFHAQFRRANPLPYKDVYTILDGVKGQGQYVGHLPGLGRQQHRLVGRGRDQVLHRRRQRVPDHLRHRHRGLLLRLLQLRRPRRTTAVPGVHHALRRPAPGDPPGRRSTSRSSASACTAGTSWTRSASSRTCG